MSEDSPIYQLSQNDLLIYGLGSHAVLCHYYLTKYMNLSVKGFCISKKYRSIEKLSGLPVFSYDDLINSPLHHPCKVVIGVGYQGMNQLRTELYAQFKNRGYTIQNVLGVENDLLTHVNIGDGFFVDHGSMIHPFVNIGNNVSIVTSNIGHHSTIGDNSFISGATIGGNVDIGRSVLVGMNAVVKDNVKIGDGTLIGMGSIIDHNTEPNSVYTAAKAVKRKIDSRRIR